MRIKDSFLRLPPLGLLVNCRFSKEPLTGSIGCVLLRKMFNDICWWGSPAPAYILKLGLRETDVVARYGGEEFGIISYMRPRERAGICSLHTQNEWFG